MIVLVYVKIDRFDNDKFRSLVGSLTNECSCTHLVLLQQLVIRGVVLV